MRAFCLFVATSLLLFGCRCSELTDEEILKERIDTTNVHLYLATKIALLKGNQSPEAQRAEKAVRETFRILSAALKPERHTTSRQPDTTEPVAAEPRDRTAQDDARLTARDALALAKALYTLKEEGEELLRSGNEKDMKPVLPILFEPSDELAESLNLNHEHALLLTGMLVLKFHKDSPVPVPVEILLYEAWMTNSDRLIPGLRSFVRMEKAFVYAGNELCDLAAQEAKGTEADQAQLEELLEVMRLAGAKSSELPETQVRLFNAGVRALAHSTSAFCYEQRGTKEKAIEELEQTLKALDDAGVPEGRTALLQAYVAMKRENYGKARHDLERARDFDGTDVQTRADIEGMLEELEDDPNVFEEHLGKAWFNYYLLKIVLRHLDEAGVFDDLKETELAKTLEGYVRMAGELTANVKNNVSQESLKTRAEMLADEVKELLEN